MINGPHQTAVTGGNPHCQTHPNIMSSWLCLPLSRQISTYSIYDYIHVLVLYLHTISSVYPRKISDIIL
jgi:hypothetical protein